MVMEKKKKTLSTVLKRKCLWGTNDSEWISVPVYRTLYRISCTQGWTVGRPWLDRPDIKVFHVLEVSCAIALSAKQKNDVITSRFDTLYQAVWENR